jgi:hypothetical protein
VLSHTPAIARQIALYDFVSTNAPIAGQRAILGYDILKNFFFLHCLNQ